DGNRRGPAAARTETPNAPAGNAMTESNPSGPRSAIKHVTAPTLPEQSRDLPPERATAKTGLETRSTDSATGAAMAVARSVLLFPGLVEGRFDFRLDFGVERFVGLEGFFGGVAPLGHLGA